MREQGAGWQFCGETLLPRGENFLLKIFLGREELGRGTGGKSWGDLN